MNDLPPSLNPETQPSSRLAATSLVLGILSLTCFGILTGLPAIIMGHIAHARSRRSPTLYGGTGLAMAGFITGYLSIVWTVVIFLVAAIALPAFHKAQLHAVPQADWGGLGQARDNAQSIQCLNHLKQLGLAFRIWATDHGDKFPFQVAEAEGGTLESSHPDADGFDPNAAKHLSVLRNELNNPRILVCPGDNTRSAVAAFDDLQPENVTYEIRTGPTIAETNPQEVLARCPVHGHELLADGSVHQRR